MLRIHSLEFGAASFFYICRPIILYTLYYDMYVRHKMPLPSSIQKNLMEEELLRILENQIVSTLNDNDSIVILFLTLEEYFPGCIYLARNI